MTDPHDMDPHDHADGHEDGHAHDQADTGTWADPEPPVSGFEDDFGDAGETGEAASVTDEHIGEHDAPPDDGADMATTDKKRNLLLPAAAVGGGVLILAAVLFWQFGGSHTQDRIPMQMTALPPAATTAPMSASVAEPPLVNTPPDVQAEPVAPKTALVTPTVVTPAVVTPTAAASVAPPVVVPATAAVPAATAATTAAASSASAAASAAAASATEARLTTLSGRMDDMQHSIEQAMLKLTQVSDRLAAQTATAGSGTATPVAASPEVENRLTRIEQRLAQIGQTPARHSSMGGLSEEDHITTRPSSHHHKAHVTHMAKLTTRKPHHKAVAQDDAAVDLPEPATTGAKNWVLRAASPDEAWVAKDDTTTELRAVHIGDSLPGIGRITAIRDQGGVWVLQGAQGAVQ